MYRTGNLCQRPAIAVHVPHWLSNLPLRYTYRTGFQTCHCGTRTTLAFKPIYRNWLSNHSKKRLNPPCHCGTCTALATFASDLPLRYTYHTGNLCQCPAIAVHRLHWLSNLPLRYTYYTGSQTY